MFEIKHFKFETVSSTQELAKHNLKSLQPNLCNLYTAKAQTQGRGTDSKSWDSPNVDNLYASYSMLIPGKISNLTLRVPQVVALAVVQTLKVFNIKAEIKWVNDVLVNSKKIAGILVETQGPTNYNNQPAFYLIIGIGININMPKNICDKISQPATSMLTLQDKKFDVDKVIASLNQNLSFNLQHFFAHGMQSLHQQINDLIYLYNHQTIQFSLNGYQDLTNLVAGKIKGIDDKGQLILETSAGTIQHFYQGKILT